MPGPGSTRKDRRDPAVVSDRHPLVVRQQRILRTKLLADRCRVMDARVEIGVVADLARQAERDPIQRHERLAKRRCCRAAAAQALADRPPQADVLGSGARRISRSCLSPSINPARLRSSTWSPIATPIRHPRACRPAIGTGRTAGSGSGTRVAGSFAESSQLVSAASCVSSRVRSWLSRVEVFLQALPASVVLVLQLRRFDRPAAVGRQTKRVSNMKAIVSLMTSGFERSARLAFSKVSASGPWPVMLLCRLAPPGAKPSALAS